MTDQEKRLQRAQLQIDLEDAQNGLEHLRKKALRMSGELKELYEKLQDSVGREPSSDDFSMRVGMTDRLRPDVQLDVPAIIEVLDELKASRQKVYNLQEQKNRLANATGWTAAS